MKLIVAIFLLGSLCAISCGKKSEEQHCYTCLTNDSVISNIPSVSKAHYKIDTGNYCQLTNAQANFLILENTKNDTFKHGDTINQEYWVMTCTETY